MTKFKNSDAIELRNQLTVAIQVAIQEALQKKVHMKVNSSSITHTALEPTGDQFTINFQVVIHEKKEEPAQ